MEKRMEKCMNWLDKNKKILFVVSTLLVVGLSIWGYTQGIFTDQTKMEQLLSDCGIMAPVVFVIIQAVQVVIPILPGSIGCVFGVVFFGAVKGFIYNYVGICIGSIWAFLIARACGRDFVKRMTGNKFYDKYSHFLIKENRFEKLFALLIFLPVAPDDFLCYLAGVSEISVKKFVSIILLGKPGALFLYSMGLSQIFRWVVSFAG